MKSWTGSAGSRIHRCRPRRTRDALAPGIKEYESAEAIEHSYLGAGGLTTFYYIASTPMSNGRLRPGTGPLQSGDPGR